MAARTYRLKITIEGREFEAEGDKSFVLEMLERFGRQSMVNEPRPAKLDVGKDSGRKGGLRTSRDKPMSIREFVQQLTLKKQTDITLAFGYYLEMYSGVSEFTPADINTCYYEAKLEASNTSQMIIQNIKTGRMMASRKKGEKGNNRYTLTQSGEAYIQSKLTRTS
ncbi:MAG: hypothetical protein ABSF14_18700 [Terriglobia bacterium]|jgi:hypothetical protein